MNKLELQSIESITVKDVVAHLEQLKEDDDSSKRLKERANEVIALLCSDVDLAVEKAIIQLEELSSSESSYGRTQIWDVISLLESVKN